MSTVICHTNNKAELVERQIQAIFLNVFRETNTQKTKRLKIQWVVCLKQYAYLSASRES